MLVIDLPPRESAINGEIDAAVYDISPNRAPRRSIWKNVATGDPDITLLKMGSGALVSEAGKL